ncbi:MAG: glycosyltransferase family 2 protein [Clostridiales bacterium]|nr:glycosyltransferase family 2 protein [Clostridiales bacterium]
MEKKLITFTVPCYNSESYMEHCIDSLLTAGDRAEILIINDGSTDRTGEIAARYQEQYPDICRVLTQENGGHGAGINHGLKEARGFYFKVVDSDDWLDEEALSRTMKLLEDLEPQGGVDLLVTNYVYDNTDPSLTSSISYKNVFPEDRIFGWEEIRGHFRPWQYLCMHASTHRTQLLRDIGIDLPKHLFYEDNLFSYLPLPYVRKLCYLNTDLYHYLIGREGQSVDEEILKKRCSHQMQVSRLMFEACDPADLKREEPKLAKYLMHALIFFMVLATAFTRLNNSAEADHQVHEMWLELKAENKPLARRLKYRSLATFLNFPGKPGRSFAIACYRLSHKFVAFN